ncbi:DHA2 family efflux MFS transporter permease subunit [Nocardia miyunensis]|uniref:DHA2 family efflux MFS transporter permease subunit n=1 Tax=Nocardia miyunensis TaxID=282684 RepID=UPI00082DF7BE|nr:DHA2 family efflux MFS transporter permease subunit [Nocardia miyunensis]
MTALAERAIDIPQASRHAWRVLTVACAGGFLASVNTSTIAVALPTVSRHFGAGAAGASWMLLSYMLVTTVLVFVFGRVTDMFGRRRMYLTGLSVLTLASLACGLAPNIGWLVALRCVQAVGAAALLCNITALVTDAFPANRLFTALGINATVSSLAQVLGPVVGGLLASVWGWRAVFWFNVPIGVVGLIWAAINLRRDTTPTKREPFDLAGAVVSSLALGGLVIALSEGGAEGWTSPEVFIGLLMFIVCGPLFVAIERHRAHPLVEPSFFAHRARTSAYIALLFMSMAYFAVVTLVALYLQAARGLEPYAAGLHVLFVAAAMSVAAPIAGRLSGYFGAKLLGSLGIALTAAGLFGLAAMARPEQFEVLMDVCLLAIGGGAGLFMTPNTSSIMSSAPAHRRGVANGVRQTTQNAGFALSTALSLAITTAGLGAAEQKAAYGGTLSSLSRGALDAFTAGYRWALVALGISCMVALVASLSRGHEVPAE